MTGLRDRSVVNSGLLGVPQRDYGKILQRQRAILNRLPEILANKSHGVMLLDGIDAAAAADAEDPSSLQHDMHQQPSQVLALDLMRRMMCWEPHSRISPRDALRHPWFHQD